MARSQFDARIVVNVPQLDRSSLAECHLGRDFTIAIADAFPVFLQELRQLGLRHAEI